ncbi:ribosomal protein S18-alanine N-acetyltransferase [Variovorax saccharolyticus]|uniref:ribosomal protein S18-alanine N-acetyltransferase n=1 Tax=Variovorax saccharolyticus TaxID=3053516 RepID=UPI0025755A2E|nr:ribosomal protein S18-alanine N-acetyltransferase [Variovorax sp. J22R187]MDM0019859.1 ribosomal protein S18-alanine N-acetyltransferase [Variovorax sp. J22R187]
MSAVMQQPREARLEPMTIERVPAVCAIERSAFTHPWTPANFTDSLAAGYHCQCLVAPAPDSGPAAADAPRGARALWNRVTLRETRESGETLIGYFVAMKGVDEVHLLNITVAPAFHGQGWAPLMLEALAGWSRGQNAQWLWLEVRASNLRALAVYERNGFRRVGIRKGYYPAEGGAREDAVVMSLRLNESPSAWGALK